MSTVEFRSVDKSFDKNVIINKLDLSLSSGEFLAIVGPSGCGKSTVLRLLAGLEETSGGSIWIDGERIDGLDPSARGVGMVFQNYALYPHMSVRENLCFPLKMARLAPSEIESRVRQAAAMLDLETLLDRRPSQLSGGQKQRVAMGRAIVKRPRVLLFDEPLSNLDAQLRSRVRGEIAKLHKSLKSTVIYVTHDQVEAMTLADRIAVFNQGRVEQIDRPMEIYRRPKTLFVASFIGHPPMNVIAKQAYSGSSPFADSASVGIRPETIKLISNTGSAPSDATIIGRGEVELVEPLGSCAHVHVRWTAPSPASVVAVVAGESEFRVGDAVQVGAHSQDLFFYNDKGELL